MVTGGDPATAISLWRHRDFMRLWAAQSVSAIGARITRTALPMLAIMTIDASASQIAFLGTLSVAPGLIVSLFAGGVIDRRAKRPLLIGADLVRAAILMTVPVAAWMGLLGMGQLYVVAAAAGAATTLFGIADNTYLPILLGRRDLDAANARLEVTDSVAEGIGPWLGGVLVGLIGAPLAILADAVSYLWSAVLLGTIRTKEAPSMAETGQSGVLSDALGGYAACMGHPIVGRLLLAQGLIALGGGFFVALYMVAALDVIGLGPATIGLVIGCGGLGSALGALAVGPVKRRLGVGRALLVTLLAGKLIDAAVPLAMAMPEAAVPLLIFGQLVGDAFMTVFFVLALSLRQEVLPQATLGRANAAFHFTEGVALVAGSIVAGLLVLVWPVLWVMVASMPLGLLAAAMMWGARSG